MNCHEQDCDQPARMAVRTTRPQRDNVIVTVWTDDRAAKVPTTAARYCSTHGNSLVCALLRVLVDGDA